MSYIFIDWSLYFCPKYSLLHVSAVLYKIFPVLRIRSPSAKHVCKRATREAQRPTVYPLSIKQVIKQEGEIICALLTPSQQFQSERKRKNSDICNPVLNANKFCVSFFGRLLPWVTGVHLHSGDIYKNFANTAYYCKHCVSSDISLCWRIPRMALFVPGGRRGVTQGAVPAPAAPASRRAALPELCLHNPPWPAGNRSLSQSHFPLEAG